MQLLFIIFVLPPDKVEHLDNTRVVKLASNFKLIEHVFEDLFAQCLVLVDLPELVDTCEGLPLHLCLTQVYFTL